MTDIRLAFRMLVRQPGMAALAIVALALGIGLTTTMFSIVNGAVLRGLPFEDSDRLYHLARLNTLANADDGDEAATLHDLVDWRARQHSFEDLAGFHIQTANVVGPDGTPERYLGAWVTPNTFRLLRVRPVLGRDFRDDDGRAGAEAVVILGDRVWRERFQADPGAIGKTVRINGRAATVVGVMEPQFGFPVRQHLWVAESMDVDPAARASSTRLSVVGRLRDGVAIGAAHAELDTIARQLQQEHPQTNRTVTVVINPYVQEFLGEETVGALFTMMIAVAGVLLIACANVANLVLARAAGRAREIAVRAAIGARRGQVIRQMLTEVLLLAALGALAGLAIAQAGVTLFSRAIVDSSPPFWIDVRIDGTVLAFVTLAAIGAAVVSGIVPALRASRAGLAAMIGDEGRTTGLRVGRFSKGLVVAEMALSFGLLVMSALLIQTIINIGRVDFGFSMADVWTGRVVLAGDAYRHDARQSQFADALVARVQSVPGVVSVALSSDIPPGGVRYAIKFPGETYATPRDHPLARGVIASPDYFKVLRAPVLLGRSFEPRDHAAASPVAIVNESFAKRFFPQGAIGRRFAMAEREHQEWRTIVGVVPDLGMSEINQGQVPEAFYVPIAQVPPGGFAVLVHAAGSPAALTPLIREAVRALDPNMPVFNVQTVAQALAQRTWAYRVFGSLFMAFGGCALVLAIVGLYGVTAFSVRRRTQEIGIRMALGARSQDVLRLILRQGLAQIVIGIVIGTGLGAALATAMRLLLFGVTPRDPATFVAIAAVLAATGLVACLVPARRAARVDPVVALRYQ